RVIATANNPRHKSNKESDNVGGKNCIPPYFFFSSRRRHTRLQGDWSSDVCSSDLHELGKGLLKRCEEPVTAGLRLNLGPMVVGLMQFNLNGIWTWRLFREEDRLVHSCLDVANERDRKSVV